MPQLLLIPALRSLTLTLIVFVFPLLLLAQDSNTKQQWSLRLNPDKIKEITNSFDEMVSLEIPGSKGHFQKLAATTYFRDFLQHHPVDSVKVKKIGTNGVDNGFVISNYYSKGTLFYLYLVTKNVSGEDVIFQMNINRQ